jgi:hypothetical protein
LSVDGEFERREEDSEKESCRTRCVQESARSSRG